MQDKTGALCAAVHIRACTHMHVLVCAGTHAIWEAFTYMRTCASDARTLIIPEAKRGETEAGSLEASPPATAAAALWEQLATSPCRGSRSADTRVHSAYLQKGVPIPRGRGGKRLG